MNHSRIAVFGSAFNPAHRGHEDVIAQVAKQFDKIVVVPNYAHAFGKKMLAYDFRLSMTRAMVGQLDVDAVVEVSDIEQALFEAGKSPIYTYDLLEALETSLGTKHLFFVIGPDNAMPEVWGRFHRANEITQRWSLWPAKENINIRSTYIRDNLAKGILPTTNECCKEVIQQLKDEYTHD